MRKLLVCAVLALAATLLPGCRWDSDPSDTHLATPVRGAK